MDLIGNLFGERLKESKFRAVPNFYGLFISLYHMNYGIPGIELPSKTITEKDIPKIINAIDDLNNILELENVPQEYFEFIKSTKDATTDVPARTTRCEYIIKKLYSSIKE